MKHLLIIPALIIITAFKVSAQGIVPAKNAAKHIGQKVTICDRVYSVVSNSNETILYLGGDQPNQLLTVIIKSSTRAKFKGDPEKDFKGKDICVTGFIVKDKGKPGIVINEPRQIKPLFLDSPVGKKLN